MFTGLGFISVKRGLRRFIRGYE